MLPRAVPFVLDHISTFEISCQQSCHNLEPFLVLAVYWQTQLSKMRLDFGLGLLERRVVSGSYRKFVGLSSSLLASRRIVPCFVSRPFPAWCWVPFQVSGIENK